MLPAVAVGAGIKPDASVGSILPFGNPVLSKPPPLGPLSGTGSAGRGEFPAGVPRRLTSWLLGFGGGTGGGGVGLVYISGSLGSRKSFREELGNNRKVQGFAETADLV